MKKTIEKLKRCIGLILTATMSISLAGPMGTVVWAAEVDDPYAGYNIYKAEEGYVVDGEPLSFKDDVKFYYAANSSAYDGYNKVDDPDTKMTEVKVFNNSGTVIGSNAAVVHFGDTSGAQVRSTSGEKSTIGMPTSTLLLPWQIEEDEEFIFTADIKINEIGNSTRWMALTVGNKLNDAEQITQHWQLVTRMNGTTAGITYAGSDPDASAFDWSNKKHNNGKQAPIDTVGALAVGNTYTLKVIGENKVIDGTEKYVLSSYIGDATIMEDYIIDAGEVAGYLGIEVNGIDVEIDYDDTLVSERDTTGYNVYNLNGQEDYRTLLQQYELADDTYYKKVDNTNIKFGKTGFTVSGGSGATNVLLPWKVEADEDFVYTGTFKVVSGSNKNYMALSFANAIDGESIEESSALVDFLHANMRCSGSNAGLSYHKGGTGWRDLIAEGWAKAPLAAGETYTFKLVITDGHVMDYYIDDLAIIRDFDLETFVGHASSVATNAAGYLGVNLKSMVLEVDYTTPEGQYEQDGYGAADYTVNSPAAVIWNTDSALEDVVSGEDLPSHFVLNVDKDMKVTSSDGTAIHYELVDLCELLYEKNSIPLIRIDDMEEAEALAAYIEQMSLQDLMVVSSDIDAAAHIVRNSKGVRGIYDVSADSKAYTTEELGTLMAEANTHDIKMILLNGASADYSTVRWLQSRLMTVWAAVSGNDEVENYTILTNGIDGVIADNYSNIKTALKSFTGENVLLRVPTIGGHRGSKAGADGSVIPECTVDALLQATAFGAEAVECDVLPTKDNVLVLQHDNTTNRMMQENVTITNTNYEDLKDILYKEAYSKNKDGVFVERTIDTLEEQFIAYADNPDAVFYLELKAVATELEEPMVTELKRLVYEYDIVDQCVVITFDTGLMAVMHDILPEVSLGYLQHDFSQELGTVVTTVEPYNATVNPSYTSAPDEYAYGLYMRGITIHPWSANGTDFDKYFVTGKFQSLSTDSTNRSRNWADRILLASDTIEIEPGMEIDFGATVINKDDEAIENAVIEPVVISGNDLVVIQDGTYSMEEGTAVVMMKYVAATDGVTTDGVTKGAQTYTLYSNPITINAVDEEFEIVTQPIDTNAVNGENASVFVEATGKGLTYKWYYKNPGNKKFYESASQFISEDGAVYTIPMYAWRDGQEVYCVITDSHGEMLVTNTVTLALDNGSIQLTKQPADVAVDMAGTEAVVTVVATGTDLTYQWYYKNPGNVKFYVSGDQFVSEGGATYTIPITAWRDGQQVYCVITDANGISVQTNTVTLSVAK